MIFQWSLRRSIEGKIPPRIPAGIIGTSIAAKTDQIAVFLRSDVGLARELHFGDWWRSGIIRPLRSVQKEGWAVAVTARSADQLKETAQLSMVPNGPI